MLRVFVTNLLARCPAIGQSLDGLVGRFYRRHPVAWQPTSASSGHLSMHQGLPIACLSGDPASIGATEGQLYGARIGRLLKLMAVQPRLVGARFSPRFARTLRAITPNAHTRLAAIATASGVKPATLIAANALVDAQCSALVALPQAGEPLRVARNMDFFPATILGSETVLSIVRETGRIPYASISWPGSVAVISGMNAAGVVACILLNHEGPTLTGGEPVGLRLAAILAHETNAEGAFARFAQTPVGSSHYVLIADRHTAMIAWHERDGVHRDLPTGPWLAASNGPRDGGAPTDARGRCLLNFAPGTPTAAHLRQVLSASYMSAINAQAMVFEPATLTLDLAIGTACQPAATNRWWRINLSELFASGSTSNLDVECLPACAPLPHYARHMYTLQPGRLAGSPATKSRIWSRTRR